MSRHRFAAAQIAATTVMTRSATNTPVTIQ